MAKPDKVARENYKESMETSYCISKRYGSMTFEELLAQTRRAFEEQGFNMVTQFDVQDHIQKSLDKSIRQYVVLGMCEPSLAHEALSVENKVGIMMPCNVIIQDVEEDGILEVSVVDPLSTMKSANNQKLDKVGQEAKERLQNALNNVESQYRKL